jgi:DNA-binding Lrp family transcriptional regulator
MPPGPDEQPARTVDAHTIIVTRDRQDPFVLLVIPPGATTAAATAMRFVWPGRGRLTGLGSMHPHYRGSVEVASRVDQADGAVGRRGGQGGMLSAYVLIQTEVGKVAHVAQAITKLDGVQLAEDLAGPYDVIARVQAPGLNELGRLVVFHIQVLDGVTRTVTCAVMHR